MKEDQKTVRFAQIAHLLSPSPTLDTACALRTKKVLLLHYQQVFGTTYQPLRRTLIASYILSSLLIGTILFFAIRARQSQTNDELHIIQTDLNSLQIQTDQFL